MTKETAIELQTRMAKEALALLALHPNADVQLYRESITSSARRGASPQKTPLRPSPCWIVSGRRSSPPERTARWLMCCRRRNCP